MRERESKREGEKERKKREIERNRKHTHAGKQVVKGASVWTNRETKLRSNFYLVIIRCNSVVY